MERQATPVAPGLDHRHLRRCGGEGGVCGARNRRISRSGRGDFAARRAAELCARDDAKGSKARATRRRDQGCRRRSRRDARRARPRDRARRRARRGRDLPRRRGRRHGDAGRPSNSAGRARYQSGAAPHDPRRHRRSRRRGRMRRRRRGRDRHSRRRSAGGENAQRPARHRRRAVDPRHHRDRRALFLLGVDPLDPSRHRCRARRRSHPHRRLPPAPVPKPRCKSFTVCRRSR